MSLLDSLGEGLTRRKFEAICKKTKAKVFWADNSSSLMDLPFEKYFENGDNGFFNSINQNHIKISFNIWGKFIRALGFDNEIDDVLLSGIFQHYLVNGILFSIVRGIDNALYIIGKNKPDHIYIKNAGFSSYIGKAFNATSKELGINLEYLEPRIYTEFRRRISTKGLYYNFKNSVEHQVAFRLNDSHNEEWNSILLDLPYSNWFNAVKPFIDGALRENLNLYMLQERNAQNRLEGSKKIEFVVDQDWLLVYNRAFNEIISIYNEKKLDGCFDEIFKYNGINFWNETKDYFDFSFNQLLPILVNQTALCHTICEQLRPQILIIATMPRSYKLGNMAIVCKKCKIPVIEIQHGIFNSSIEHYLPPLLVDKIACGGSYWKERYVERGAPINDVIVTGWPKYDRYSAMTRKVLEISKDKIKKILFLTQEIYLKHNIEIIKTISESINKDDYVLYIKPHPNEKRSFYSSYCKDEKVILLDPADDIFDYIRYSDIVLIHNSTAGLEAVLCGKPILCLNLDKIHSPIIDNYVNAGVAKEITNLNQLIIWIKEFSKENIADLQEKQANFILEQAYLQDGNASRRVLDLVLKVLRRSHEADYSH